MKLKIILSVLLLFSLLKVDANPLVDISIASGKEEVFLHSNDIPFEIRKRLLNYILCIRFFIEVHSIVSASRFFHMPTYLRVVIECQSRFFPIIWHPNQTET